MSERQKTIVTEKEGASRAMISAGWQDVPHIDKEMQEALLAETPPWLREARSQGVPSLGAGAIYPIPEKDIRCDPFPIPDWWPRAFALDVGWNWTAALWAAWDRENGTMYLYSSYKKGEERPPIHASAIKARGTWVPGLIDPAANGRSQIDGEKLIEIYANEGLNLSKPDNSVESGIYNCWVDLSINRLKVFSTLTDFFQEYRFYQRDEKGKIVKKNDHLLDCMRYLRNSGSDIALVKPVEALQGVNVRPYNPGKAGY